MDALTYTHQCEVPPAVLARYIRPHQRPNPCRIHVGDVGKVDNERTGSIGPDGALKSENCGHHQWTIQPKNALSGLRSGLVVDAEGILRHGGDINLRVTSDC